jgi:hypothetical protein
MPDTVTGEISCEATHLGSHVGDLDTCLYGSGRTHLGVSSFSVVFE